MAAILLSTPVTTPRGTVTHLLVGAATHVDVMRCFTFRLYGSIDGVKRDMRFPRPTICLQDTLGAPPEYTGPVSTAYTDLMKGVAGSSPTDAEICQYLIDNGGPAFAGTVTK